MDPRGLLCWLLFSPHIPPHTVGPSRRVLYSVLSREVACPICSPMQRGEATTASPSPPSIGSTEVRVSVDTFLGSLVHMDVSWMRKRWGAKKNIPSRGFLHPLDTTPDPAVQMHLRARESLPANSLPYSRFGVSNWRLLVRLPQAVQVLSSSSPVLRSLSHKETSVLHTIPISLTRDFQASLKVPLHTYLLTHSPHYSHLLQLPFVENALWKEGRHEPSRLEGLIQASGSNLTNHVCHKPGLLGNIQDVARP
ncbi:hypothetical protein HOY80DRAFT_66771 [Tuber brumale]|nr:hypothetical protein HOY80DRAFT_66771 [Tuber brumale]